MKKKATEKVEAGEVGHESILVWNGYERSYYHFESEEDAANYLSDTDDLMVMKVVFKPTHTFKITPPVPKKVKLVALRCGTG